MSPDKTAVLTGGLATIAIIIWYFFRAPRRSATAVLGAAGVQEALITVKGGYEPAVIRVRAGEPVRLLFDRQETNPCSEEVVLSDFKIRRFLPPHQRTPVEFTPTEPGNYEITCGMGMLHGRVIVS